MKTLEEKLEEKNTPWKELPFYKRVFHPNRQSAISVPLTIGGAFISAYTDYDATGISMMITGSLLDLSDGYLSRKWDMKTIEGAKLDPAADKARFISSGGLMSYLSNASNGNLYVPIAYGLAVTVDIFSQIKRWIDSKTSPLQVVEETYRAIIKPEKCHIDEEEKSVLRANNYGKYKAWIQTIPTITYFGINALEDHGFEISQVVQDNYEGITATLLGIASGIGATGIYKRINGKK